MRLRDWAKVFPIFVEEFKKYSFRNALTIFRALRTHYPQKHNDKIIINATLPPYPSDAFKNTIEAVKSFKRRPLLVSIVLNGVSQTQDFKSKQLGISDTVDLVGQCSELGSTKIDFIGNDPLLRDDIIPIVSAVAENNSVAISSSGWGLTGKLARSLLAAGLDCLSINIESVAIGPNLRESTLSFSSKALRTAVEAGLYTVASTTATREKIESGEIDKITDYASKAGAKELVIMRPRPLPVFGSDFMLPLSDEHINYLESFSADWNNKEAMTITSFTNFYFKKIRGCIAGCYRLHIDVQGNVYPCEYLPCIFGNIYKEQLSDIWQRMGEYFQKSCNYCVADELRKALPDKKFNFPAQYTDISPYLEKIRSELPKDLPECCFWFLENQKILD